MTENRSQIHPGFNQKMYKFISLKFRLLTSNSLFLTFVGVFVPDI